MQVSVFGLGKMGMQIAKRLHVNNFNVLAWNRSPGPRASFEEFIAKHPSLATGSKAYEAESDVVGNMAQPRVCWLMLPNTIVEEFLFGPQGLAKLLKPGDIVIDGGNSFYKDSINRAEKLKSLGILFFDCGTSGGVWGFDKGFALMVGGPKEAWQAVEPVFKALSSGDNYGLMGSHGSGHFVKMVHNGIEYGMMEAIAEGYSVLKASKFNLDLGLVTKVYKEGSVVRSWLIDLMADIFAREDIQSTIGLVKATGEGEWTVNAGKELGVDVRVIEASLQVRRESEMPENQNQFRNKILALLRKQFGGHAVEIGASNKKL